MPRRGTHRVSAAPALPGWRRDLRWATSGLLAVLLWDLGGADLAVMRWFGDAGGFALRDHWFAAGMLHDGGRWLGRVAMAALVLNTVWPLPVLGDMPRAQRVRWCLVTLLCLLAVSSLKRWSALSCPWSLAQFGGSAHYVSHWAAAAWRGGDGGPGQCFPGGHASGAFAFFVGAFALRERSPRAARLWLAGVCVVGVAFGAAQLVRGAHYPSHTLWTAWICWTLGALAWHARTRGVRFGHTARHGQQHPSG